MTKPTWFERWAWRNGSDQPFSPEEIAALEQAWLKHIERAKITLHKIEKKPDGLWVSLTPNSHLQIQPNRVVFHGDAAKDDAAIAASLHHAKEAWGGRLAVNGGEDFKMRSWAHAQIQGLEITNYQPRAHLMAEAQRLVASLKAGYYSDKQNDPAPSANAESEADWGGPSGGTPRYVPPRNAVDDLFAKAPFDLQELMREQLEVVSKENPIGAWPYEPYHYGMGRIMGYENWLASLSEEERKREIAACRTRYEAHYQRSADLLVKKMRDLGHELEPHDQGHDKNEGEPDQESLRQLRKNKARRPNDRRPNGRGPSLGGGRGR
jgi:hypothetical protein